MRRRHEKYVFSRTDDINLKQEIESRKHERMVFELKRQEEEARKQREHERNMREQVRIAKQKPLPKIQKEESESDSEMDEEELQNLIKQMKRRKRKGTK